MSDISLPGFQRGDSTFYSAGVEPRHGDLHDEEGIRSWDLWYFLGILQHFRLDIIPISWQPALEELGRGNSAVVNQSQIHINLNFAFKRFMFGTDLKYLIAEIAILSIPTIRSHPNIQTLEGVCWERQRDEDGRLQVWPVLVSPKADMYDLRVFMKSDMGRNTTLQQSLSLCFDVGRALKTMHARSKRSPSYSIVF